MPRKKKILTQGSVVIKSVIIIEHEFSCHSVCPIFISVFNLIFLNRALEVITRIQAKLTGRDFAKADHDDELSVSQQIDRLIREATSVENLCQLYQGWCPMW
jgi:phosphatidylinositol kinase/protein kinase (PI-3  family)